MSRPNPATIVASRFLVDCDELIAQCERRARRSMTQQEASDWSALAQTADAARQILELACGACRELGEVDEHAVAFDMSTGEVVTAEPVCPTCGRGKESETDDRELPELQSPSSAS